MILYNTGKQGIDYIAIGSIHWNTINPKRLSDNEYKIHESLIGRLNKAIEINEGGNEKNKLRFLRYLRNNSYKELENIVTTPAITLNRVIKRTSRKLKKYKLYNNKEFYQQLSKIFQYSNWRGNGKFEEIFNLLDIPICPYCNINPIHKFNEPGREIMVTSVDHYYDQATYPYLSLTLSNLIPVCKVCNETFKKSLPFCIKTHIHPYIDNYNILCLFNCNIILGNLSPLRLEYTLPKIRTEKFNQDLGLLGRYNIESVLKETKRIYYLSEDYPDSRKKELVNTWSLLTNDEVERKICDRHHIPYAEKEIRIVPLGKLKRDIAIKIGVISKT